jgi:uncharacterized membrane protein YfcA
MESPLLSVALGLVIGLSLGLLGGGGSILTVPALVYLIGLPVEVATGTSLAIVGMTAVAGAIGHGRAGRVALRPAIGFALASIAGSVAGSLLGRQVDEQLLLVLFAVVMIAAGLSMLRQRHLAATPPAPQGGWSAVRVGAVGFGVGMLTGFFGVGGGFVIVPALTLVLGLSMPRAVGTSLVVIALAAAAGLLMRVDAGGLDLGVTLLVVTGGLAGTVAGSHLTGAIPELRLRQSFAALVLVLAAVLLVQNAGPIGAVAWHGVLPR